MKWTVVVDNRQGPGYQQNKFGWNYFIGCWTVTILRNLTFSRRWIFWFFNLSGREILTILSRWTWEVTAASRTASRHDDPFREQVAFRLPEVFLDEWPLKMAYWPVLLPTSSCSNWWKNGCRSLADKASCSRSICFDLKMFRRSAFSVFVGLDSAPALHFGAFLTFEQRATKNFERNVLPFIHNLRFLSLDLFQIEVSRKIKAGFNRHEYPHEKWTLVKPFTGRR